MSIEIPDWLKYEIAERWHRCRQAVNRNPRVVLGVTLASGFVLILIFISLLSGEPRPTSRPVKKAWFYDLNTGGLFAGPDDKAGPIEAPSGPLPDGKPAGVRAYVYSFKPEPGRDDLLIGYLSRPDSDASVSNSNTAGADGADGANGADYRIEGELLRTVADANWVPAASPAGKRILRQATGRNEVGRIPRYSPPR